MKKSPLSTPGGSKNFHQGRNHNGGFGYYHQRNNNGNFFQMPGSNSSFNSGLEGDMIPLGTSSPIKHHKRNNWHYQNNKQNQYSYDTGCRNNQRNSFSNNSVSPYPLHKPHKHFQQNQKRDNHWYRNLPISEFIDIRSIFIDPWEQFEDNCKNVNTTNSTIVDSSVEIIYENDNKEFSSESTLDTNTFNITSSSEDVKEGSSVDLHLDKINFSRESKGTIVLSDNSSHEQLLDNSTNLTHSESVIVIEN